MFNNLKERRTRLEYMFSSATDNLRSTDNYAIDNLNSVKDTW
jgi:hypothetical protein